MLFLLQNSSKVIFQRKFIFRIMQQASASSYLIEESKYSFLKDLGLEKNNFGVYHGRWTGSGKVCKI